MPLTPLEKIIRPIVEGQIRGFAKEHPAIIEAVDWFRKKNHSGGRAKSKLDTFVDSLAKRIVRDLTCGSTSARLAGALLEGPTDASPEDASGNVALEASPARLEL